MSKAKFVAFYTGIYALHLQCVLYPQWCGWIYDIMNWISITYCCLIDTAGYRHWISIKYCSLNDIAGYMNWIRVTYCSLMMLLDICIELALHIVALLMLLLAWCQQVPWREGKHWRTDMANLVQPFTDRMVLALVYICIKAWFHFVYIAIRNLSLMLCLLWLTGQIWLKMSNGHRGQTHCLKLYVINWKYFLFLIFFLCICLSSGAEVKQGWSFYRILPAFYTNHGYYFLLSQSPTYLHFHLLIFP